MPASVRRLLLSGIRLVLALLALLCVSGGARAAEPLWLTPREAGAALEAEFDFRMDDGSAAARLLLLPTGTRSVDVIAATGEGGAPSLPREAIHAGPVMQMRGTALAPLWIDASLERSLTQAGVTRIVVRLSARDGEGRVVDSGEPAIAGGPPGVPFGMRRAPAAGRHAGEELVCRGGYLIITADAYAGALQPLIEWKRACGYDVRLRRTSETGRTLTEIETYVRNAYETWSIPPVYLLLVGDVEEIPSGDMLGNVTDHVYACVDGDDFAGDVFVGRFSAKNEAEVAVQVAKTVGYESRPEARHWTRRPGSIAPSWSPATTGLRRQCRPANGSAKSWRKSASRRSTACTTRPSRTAARRRTAARSGM